MNKYSQIKDGFYCHSHKLIFKDKCPKCFTSNSEQLTSKSKRSNSPKRKYIRKVNSSIFERFHNFGVRFDASVDWDLLFQFVDCFLGKTRFKRIDFPEAIVKVFRKSILITLRSSMELKGLPVKVAEAKSMRLVSLIVSRLPKAIIVDMPEVVNTHNAFVNHPVAKYDLNVSVDGQSRLISDKSKGYLELEAVNPKMAVSDSVLIEDDLRSLIGNGLSRDFLASALKDLVDDRKYYAENLRSHVEAIKSLKEGIDSFNAQLGVRFGTTNHSSMSPFSSHPENVGRVHSSAPISHEVSSLPIQSNLMRWFE